MPGNDKFQIEDKPNPKRKKKEGYTGGSPRGSSSLFLQQGWG